jgi:hypothetical protein
MCAIQFPIGRDRDEMRAELELTLIVKFRLLGLRRGVYRDQEVKPPSHSLIQSIIVLCQSCSSLALAESSRDSLVLILLSCLHVLTHMTCYTAGTVVLLSLSIGVYQLYQI